MKKTIFFFLLAFNISVALAEHPDFSKYFDVDLDAPIPDLEALRKEFEEATEVYDPKYFVTWNMGRVFKKVWRDVILNYGTTERRLRGAGDQELEEMIASLPKEVYPYIGPYLHSSAGVSEKILNMPGIKETKNKFPERIAPQLKDIEDLEFLSPVLYILLMPETWPENNKTTEKPIFKKVKIDPIPYRSNFYSALFDKVPEGGFGGANARGERPLKDKIRTMNVTKESPLTTADILAFANTLDGVLAFSTLDNQYKLISTGTLLNFYEAKNETALDLNNLKDIANPCQRLALKIKWAGLETEFLKSISKEGFNLKEWAYTCEKTIKAYRAVLISDARLASLQMYKKGLYDAYLNSYSKKWKDRQFATFQSLLEMYKTNKNDIWEVMKNEKIVKEKLKPFGSVFVSEPLGF